MPPEVASPARVSIPGNSGDSPEGAAGADWSDAPIVVPPLDMVKVDFDLRVGSLLVQELKLGQTHLLATLQGGRLVVTSGDPQIAAFRIDDGELLGSAIFFKDFPFAGSA